MVRFASTPDSSKEPMETFSLVHLQSRVADPIELKRVRHMTRGSLNWGKISSVGMVFLLLLAAISVRAQEGTATLSGTVTEYSGKAVPNAKVSIKNVATAQSSDTQADAAGAYSLSSLPPGDYEVSASADGFGTGVAKVTLTPAGRQILDLSLSSASTPASSSQQTPTNQPTQNLPN